MTLHELNELTEEEKRTALMKCCGSVCWVDRMMSFFPMDDLVELLEDAEEQWYLCTEADWKEAFTHHPKIGDINSLKEKFAGTAKWAEGEQDAIHDATENTLVQLQEANELYEQKFGYIFIVCATGKAAEEMLALLQERMHNSPEAEIKIAMDEQNKITLLRLQKLLT